MDPDLQNALAFYQPAPAGWFSGFKEKMKAAGEWIWETIQGDFNDDQTTAQIITGTVISMIPLVDQICDVRDCVANCKKINEDTSNTLSWISLVLTLIGLFPTLGSFVKGSLKVLLLYGRKVFLSTKVSEKLIKISLEKSIAALNKFLDMPAVRYALKIRKIYNAYHYLEEAVRKLMRKLSVPQLLESFDSILSVTRSLLDKVISWGPESLRHSVDELWGMLQKIRGLADEMLGKVLGPVNGYLEQLANKLRVEGDNLYRARIGDNTHILGDWSKRGNAEIELFENDFPDWVDKGVKDAKYPALDGILDKDIDKINKGWPDLRDSSNSRVAGKYNTFDDSMHAVIIDGSEKIYRILDPFSNDNSICWMREAEFNALSSKSDWRRRFAVWKYWNENGEYVVYTVPEGGKLKVWEGRASTQINEFDKEYSLEGGAVQIVLEPNDLKVDFISQRMKTGWGYQDVDSDPISPYLGLPALENKNKWGK
ncbi:hypothetical protein YV76_004643 [Salmonella enterica subsp. enterica]|nr:hypothetical protein [Salmonella enterica subsp. enterica]